MIRRRLKLEPVPEMSEAERVQRLHAELKELDASDGPPKGWSELNWAMRRQEIRRTLRMMGDVV
jgi:hypothetical protein